MKILQAMHQGDVLFLKIKELPALETRVEPDKNLGLVIQHGEALGHYHRVANPATLEAFFVGVKDTIKEMALVVKEATNVVHEEHRALTLTPGFWIARTQKETFQELVRPVLD